MPIFNHWADRQKSPPTSRPSHDVTDGRVARELPVAPALLIRQDLAQKETLIICENLVSTNSASAQAYVF